MRRTADAVVIGAGILGTSITLELTRRGLRTVIVDRSGDVGQGATRSSTAVVTCCYGTKDGIALAYEARKLLEAWADHLAIERPRARLEQVGCALLMSDHGPGCDELMRLMRAVGVPVESLSGREAQGLVPGMRAARTRVLFDCGAGYISSATSAAGDVRRAAEAVGARFELGETVVEIRSSAQRRGGARRVAGLRTASGLRIDAPVVVNAAGAHAAQIDLLAGAPLPLNTVAVVKHTVRNEIEKLGSLPVVTDVPADHLVRFDRRGFELAPIEGGRDGGEYALDPGSPPAPPKSYLLDLRRAFLRRHPDLRWRDAKVATAVSQRAILDRYPIVDRTDLDGYYVAVGTNGCWCRGGPATAWLASELIRAVEAGHDHDREPLQLTLPRTGTTFNLGLLSRNRRPIRPEVAGLLA